ncbi:MAG: sigma-70 family RNA polymerase sigma factor [Myxococcales bacterium]|nr:sigma-70 family RNA polymerase sigma factor [Myxococcales bacterium]MCB9606768.1 sigma-70 family RNA polymerase sigma factor [Polyangiaceae bacterium]
MDDSDEALLEAARAGDSKALEALLARYQSQVYRFGMRMCRDPEDAKDVLQDTLIATARGVRDFRGASSISTWLYSIARSFCIKKRRRSKFAPEVERSLDTEVRDQVSAMPSSGRHPEDAVAGKQIQEALERAIGRLEPMYREVLVLRDVEGLSAQEVSEVLDISVQAVKSRLHRARIAVRNDMLPLLQDQPRTPAGASCPDVLQLFSQHLEDEISQDTCKRMEEHLEGCERCRTTCNSLKQSLAMCRTAAPNVPLPEAVQRSVRVALQEALTAAES